MKQREKARTPNGQLTDEELLLKQGLAELRSLLQKCGFNPSQYLKPHRVQAINNSGDTAHFLRAKGGRPGDLIPAARIFQLWHCEPRFVSEAGEPLPLPLSGEASLTTLVKEVGCKVDARIVRDTMVGAGLVQRHGDFTRPLTRAVIGKGSARIKQILYSVRDLFSTLNYNLGGGEGEPKQFQRFVFDTKVPTTRAEEFDKFLETQAMAFLLSVEEWMSTAERQAAAGEPLKVINVHVFASARAGESQKANDPARPGSRGVTKAQDSQRRTRSKSPKRHRLKSVKKKRSTVERRNGA
jgi:hypothetical protein